MLRRTRIKVDMLLAQCVPREMEVRKVDEGKIKLEDEVDCRTTKLVVR